MECAGGGDIQMDCQFSVACCHMPSLTSAQSTASLDGAFPFVLHPGQKWLRFLPRDRIRTTCALLGRRGWTTSITRILGACKDNWVTLLFSVLATPLPAFPPSPPAAVIPQDYSATGKVGHGARLFAARSQTPTIDKHLLWWHPVLAILFVLFHDAATLKGEDWESSARVPSLSSFRPLLKVTSLIQNIVCKSDIVFKCAGLTLIALSVGLSFPVRRKWSGFQDGFTKISGINFLLDSVCRTQTHEEHLHSHNKFYFYLR